MESEAMNAMSLHDRRSKTKQMHYRDYPFRGEPRFRPSSWISRHALHGLWESMPTIVALVGATILALLIGGMPPVRGSEASPVK